MTRTITRIAAALLLLFPLVVPRAQESQEEVVRVGASEVALDVVVRDKKGRIVRDLKPTDFEVYEDGVRQQVGSFRLVVRRPEAEAKQAGANDTAAKPNDTARPDAPAPRVAQAGAVALVFDRLTPDSQRLARQAATGLLSGLAPEDFVGVFRVELSLQAVQPFTRNAQLVSRAVERATSAAASAGANRAGQIAQVARQQEHLEAQRSQLEAQGGGAGASTNMQAMAGAAQQNAFDSVFAEMTRRSLETFDALERTQQGYATTNGLLAVIDGMAQLPGRKLLVLFSEGLAIPPAVEAPFRTLISNANRAGVSIYAVDAVGLRATSADAETARALNALGQQRIRQAASRNEPNRPMMLDLERNEDLLRLSPSAGLGRLADQTGGILVSNTNDPGTRLRAAGEDLHTYYALSYSPTNQNFDGRFRQITVKLNRPGLDVQARKGYYAINAEYASPVLDYEAPALAILGGGKPADALPVRAAAFSFPEPSRPGLSAVVVEIPAEAVNFTVDAARKTYRADFSVVALVRDESRRVVRKLSNHYVLGGPAERLDAARRGAVLFYREAELEPGRYTVEAAAHDTTTGRAGTGSGRLDVPQPDASKPRLASVVIISRAERVTADGQQAVSPFRFGEMLVYPNLGAPLSKSSFKEVALLLTAYASQGSAVAPKLTLEIAQAGRTLARVPLALPAPDSTGRIQYASTIPTEKLPPGTYQLTVTAEDERGKATRTETFTIKP